MNININELIELSKKPKIFTPGDSFLWTDPHIAGEMLKTHINPNTDSASRKPGTIDKTVDFIIRHLDLKAGDSILDAGCGPGLYCERFKKRGLSVTGIDISSNSIEYARDNASNKGLDIRYVCNNYLDMDFENEFDAVFMIWWDFCVLTNEGRKKLLKNIKRALKPGGRFVFDVSTPLFDEGKKESSSWKAYDGGFFAAGPHTVYENRFNYTGTNTYLTQYIVVEDSGTKIFRLYHTHYTKDSITRLLKENGFSINDIFEDLCGTPYTNESMSMGIIASAM